jgi:hypothetical protein
MMIVTNHHVRLYHHQHLRHHHHHHHHLLFKELGHSLTDLSLIRLLAFSSVVHISFISVACNISVVKMPVFFVNYWHCCRMCLCFTRTTLLLSRSVKSSWFQYLEIVSIVGSLYLLIFSIHLHFFLFIYKCIRSINLVSEAVILGLLSTFIVHQFVPHKTVGKCKCTCVNEMLLIRFTERVSEFRMESVNTE